MKVSRLQIVSNGLTNRCPNCGERTLFKRTSWFELNQHCPNCGLPFERDEGFFLGAMSLNYGVTICVFLVPVLLLYLTGVLAGTPAAVLAGSGAFIFPVLFYRSSRSWWLMSYYLFLPHHLPANQINPASGRDKRD